MRCFCVGQKQKGVADAMIEAGPTTFRSTREVTVQRKSIGLHQDEVQDGVADVACGHQQHVRHTPPWVKRPRVVSPEGRRSRFEYALDCADCEQRVHERALPPGHALFPCR